MPPIRRFVGGIAVVALAAVGCTLATDDRSKTNPTLDGVENAVHEAEVDADHAARIEASFADRTARIDVGQASHVIVMSDAERYAEAMRGGRLGTPEVDSDAVARATVQRRPVDDPVDPRIDEPGASEPNVWISQLGTTSLGVTYACRATSTATLTRIAPNGTRQPLASAAACGTAVGRTDTGLTPGETYCYELRVGSVTKTACGRTRFEPYVFAGPGLGTSQANAMAASFDWLRTEPVSATVSEGGKSVPALYSMNILVQNADDLLALRGLGIHTQTQPLFAEEQAGWGGAPVSAVVGGKLVGMWITAVVPGAVYNDLRKQSADSVRAGKAPGIAAMVFRRAPVADAVHHPALSVSPLRIEYVAKMGLQFNGYSATECSGNICSTQQAIVGWLVRKAISIAANLVMDAVHGVRQVYGAIQRLIKGEVNLTIRVAMKNADEAFGASEPMRSGWRGVEIHPANLRVRVYQNVAEFTGRADATGATTVSVSKELPGRVCLELDNSVARIIDSFIAREVCVGTFPKLSSSTTLVFDTTNPYLYQLLAMTDAAAYAKNVLGYTVPKIEVATGWLAGAATAVNGGRAFVTCQGRFPNVVANVVTAIPVVNILAEIAEFGTAYDMILDDGSIRSRGVGVHEYGHVVMCSMLREASFLKGQTAWADLMLGTLTGQSGEKEQAVLGEGFADFIALQVVGGANYTEPSVRLRSSRNTNYCNGVFVGGCYEPNSQRCTVDCEHEFHRNVKWVTSLLQDAFDSVATGASQSAPNDGSHWTLSDDGAFLVPYASANSVLSTDGDALALPGSALLDTFRAWADRASTLRYESFFGALAKVLADRGYRRPAVCEVFAAREPSNECPAFVVREVPMPSPTPPPAPTGSPWDEDPDRDPCVGERARHIPACML